MRIKDDDGCKLLEICRKISVKEITEDCERAALYANADVCKIPKAFAPKKFELVILGGGYAAFAAALKAAWIGVGGRKALLLRGMIVL